MPDPVKPNPTPKPASHKKTIFILILLPLLLATLAGIIYKFFYLTGKLPFKPTSNLANQSTQPKAISLSQNLPQFAEFKEETATISASIPSYTINIGELENLKAVEKAINKSLTSSQSEALTKSGFFITQAENKLKNGEEEVDFTHGGTIDEFLMHYKDISGNYSESERQPENVVFITSDLLLHTYHVFVDRTFQYIEESEFHPKLLVLTTMMFEKSLEEQQKTTDPKLKDSLQRLIGFFLIPKVILETSANQSDENIDKPENILGKLETYKNQLPQDVFTKAKLEIELINQSKDMAVSPLFGEFKVGQFDDYSQYKPRSHYTKNSLLRSYWKAMIWYGRNGFLTKSDELTLDGLVQTIIIKSLTSGEQKALSLWENIYLPTVFFVGKSDDLTIYDFTALSQKIYGTIPNLASLTDEAKFNQFKEEVKKLAGPAIQSSIIIVNPEKTSKEEALSETKSFRFMGQRFIPDSFIFSKLTQGQEIADEETGQKLPPVPTALMPMSIFGSLRAQTHLNDWISKKAPESDKVIPKKMKELSQVFDRLTLKDWTQNMYWSWLYTLKSLFQAFGQGYPTFMQSILWNDKDLNTSLGSWTELRHDTLLYAKQSYAEMGGMNEPKEPLPVPKGYVEPNLTFLNRIIALSKMTEDGLTKNQVLPEEQKFKLQNLQESFTFYRDFAIKELNNEKISDEEFEKLRVSVLGLNQALTPPTGAFMKASEVRAGLIADVHTSIPTQEILYEATGIPNIIYVAVKDINGTRLARGVTYSYYEFTHAFGERLSDQDWQQNVYEEKNNFPLPEIPDWTKALLK